MQTPVAAIAAAAAAGRPADRYVVRPAGVLADLLGAAELGEDELLLRLRDPGLITYPSPLLGGLTEKLPEVLAAEVLSRLNDTDLILFGQAGRACRAAVVASACRTVMGFRETIAMTRGARGWTPRVKGHFALSSGSTTLSGPSSGWLGPRQVVARGTRTFVSTPPRAGTWRC
jgi:hypothetical protein